MSGKGLEVLLALQAGAACAMAGVIWFVQVVHYPLFAKVGVDAFPAYHAAHARLTTWVVGPLMLAEAAAAVALWLLRPAGASPAQLWAGVLLVALIWATTFLVAVPRHGALAGGFDPAVAAGLVTTNWVRTAAWTAHAAVALLMARDVLTAAASGR